MLATPWPAPFSDDNWVFELKWDGVRCLLTSHAGRVHLHSRAGNDMTGRYPEISRSRFAADLVLDGEIVALDHKGRPSFELLQSRMGGRGADQVPVSFVVFDILHHGSSLIRLPWQERHLALTELELPASCVAAEHHRGDATPVWDFVTGNGLEGIVAKRLGSTYQPGVRSPSWRKISHFSQVRAVVAGFTPGTGGRESTFGSLILGLWSEAGLRWIGSVGSGFDDQELRAIRAALDEMTVAAPPLIAQPDLPDGIWVEPRLVAIVRFKQWTQANRLRAPSFKGFSDVAARQATWAREGPG